MMQEAKPVTSARQNPAEISPETFTWSLLNDIFWKAGRKVRSLEIGGVTVSKSLTLYLSNSGKKHDWKVASVHRKSAAIHVQVGPTSI